MSIEQYNIAKQMYLQNKSLRKISEELNINRKLLSKKLKEDNIIIRDKNKNQTIKSKSKYSFNENIFENIDTEAKAYWLGFLYADGYVNSEKGIELTLKSEDLCHIEAFKDFIKSNHVIEYRDKVNAYRLNIYSVKMANDLIKLGCLQNKSLILTFPTEQQVPKKYISHFMRGYFDGDGCVSYGQGQLRFSVLGCKDFLLKYESIILDVLERKEPNKWGQDGQAFNIRYSGNKQVSKIFNFLYKDANIYLKRKYNKFAVLRQKSQKS